MISKTNLLTLLLSFSVLVSGLVSRTSWAQIMMVDSSDLTSLVGSLGSEVAEVVPSAASLVIGVSILIVDLWCAMFTVLVVGLSVSLAGWGRGEKIPGI